MNCTSNKISAPFVSFDPKTWASFKHSSEKLTLTEADLGKFLAFNDKLSLDDVKNIYLPLSSLLRMYYISRHDRLSIIQKFLGSPMESVPFIISISGSVSVGKTLILRWNMPKSSAILSAVILQSVVLIR